MNLPEDRNDRETAGANRREDDRKARLAERLRANLQRRKTQARSRRAGAADQRPEGMSAGTETKESGDDAAQD